MLTAAFFGRQAVSPAMIRSDSEVHDRIRGSSICVDVNSRNVRHRKSSDGRLRTFVPLEMFLLLLLFIHSVQGDQLIFASSRG